MAMAAVETGKVGVVTLSLPCRGKLRDAKKLDVLCNWNSITWIN